MTHVRLWRTLGGMANHIAVRTEFDGYCLIYGEFVKWCKDEDEVERAVELDLKLRRPKENLVYDGELEDSE